MSKKFFLAAALLCACATAASAREIVMDVDSILGRIPMHNSEVRSARSHYRAKRQGVAVASSARLPEITASLNLNYLGDGTVVDRDFSNAMRDRLPHFGNTLTVSLYQPIYQGGAITAGIDLARLDADLAAIGMDQQADASGIQALAAYFNLMKMHNLRKVYAENISITLRLIEQMTEKYNQGTVLQNDITRYELRLSSLRFDLRSVDNSISVYNHELTSLLGLCATDTVVPAPLARMPPMEPEAQWQAWTRSRSNELRAIDKSRELVEAELRRDRASRLPSIGIVAGDSFIGPITFEIPALNKNYNAWFAGVSIKYNISSLWTTGKKERQRKIEILHMTDRREAMADALERRVHQAYVAMVQASQMLDTEQVNVRLANENYDIVQTRFHNDMALLTDMLDASAVKLDSEVRLVNARINLMLAYYQLKYISGSLTNN